MEIAGSFVNPSGSQDDFVFLQSASLTSASCRVFAMPKTLHYFPPFFLGLSKISNNSVILCPKFCIVFPK